MPNFQYYQGEEKPTPQRETQTATPAAPPNALQFFDDAQAGAQAWSGVVDVAMEAGSVAVDIYSKLGEAEHQNKADAFYLEYTQQIGQLKDNINSGQAESNIHDLDDVQGVTSYYQDEESKIYGDLSKKFNKDNYKRRDSLMKDRKTPSYLGAMSNIRQNKISQISQNSKDGFDIYLKASTRENTDAVIKTIKAEYEAGKFNLTDFIKEIEALKKEYNNGKGEMTLQSYNEKMAEYKKIVDNFDSNVAIAEEAKDIQKEIYVKTELEAKKRYHSGILSEEQYKDIHNEVARNVQGTAAYQIAVDDYTMFLDILENKPDTFGMADQKYLLQLKSGALKRKEIDENNTAKKANYEDYGKFLRDYNLAWDSIPDLEALDKKLDERTVVEGKKKYTNYPKWTDEYAEKQRGTARLGLKRRIDALKKAKAAGADKGASKTELNASLDNLMKSIEGPDKELPEWKYNIDLTYKKEPLLGEMLTARKDMLYKAGGLYKQLRMGAISHADVKQSLTDIEPQDSTSPTYGSAHTAWKYVDTLVKKYDANKRENFVSVTRAEMNNEEDRNLESIQNTGDAIKALRADSFDQDGLVSNGLIYYDKKIPLQTFKRDKNLQVLSPLRIVSPRHSRLLSLVPHEQRKALVKELYPGYEAMAFKDLQRDGVHLPWHAFSEDLTTKARKIRVQSEKDAVVPQTLPNGLNYLNASKAFMEVIGSGIETSYVRGIEKDAFMKYISQMKDVGDKRDYEELAEEFYEGIVLVRMPNHRGDHLQKHIWMGEKEISRELGDFMWRDNTDDLAGGVMSMLLKFSKEDLADDELFVMGTKDLSPAYLVKLTEDEINQYPKIREIAVDLKNRIFQANSVSNNSNDPVFTIVRSPNGEDFNLAIKNHPIGGIFRVGRKDVNGNMKVVTYKKEQFFEHASFYMQRLQAQKLTWGPQSFTGSLINQAENPMNQFSDDINTDDLLEELKKTDNSSIHGKALHRVLRKIEEEIELDPGMKNRSKYRDGKATIKSLAEKILGRGADDKGPKLQPQEKDFLLHVKEFLSNPLAKTEDLMDSQSRLGF